MRWIGRPALVLVLVLVLVSCADQQPAAGPATPTAPTPTAATLTTGTSTRATSVAQSTPPVRVTKAQAGRTLRDLPPIDGFKLRTFCLTGPTEKCEMPSNPRWAMHAEWRGKRFHGRGRDASHDLMLLAVLAHQTRARATEMVRDVRRRLGAGRIDEPTKDLPNDEYRTGRIGSGTVSRIAAGGWRGVTGVARVRRPGDRLDGSARGANGPGCDDRLADRTAPANAWLTSPGSAVPRQSELDDTRYVEHQLALLV